MYIGKSAGAIVAGTTVETATWKGWDDPSVVPPTHHQSNDEDWKKGHAGLSLAGSNTAFFPHMNDEWKTLVSERQKEISAAVVCLGEGDACCVDGTAQKCFVISPEENAIR